MEQDGVEHQNPGDPLRTRESERRNLNQGLCNASADAHRLGRLDVLGLCGLASARAAGLFA